MYILMVYVMVVIAFISFVMSLLYKHLILGVVSVVAWIISSVSFIQIEIPTGYSVITYENPFIPYFSLGMTAVSLLWLIYLVFVIIYESTKTKGVWR